MQSVLWELTYQSAPKVLRYCQKCGEKTRYQSSGLFRVNAQKKSLDIWLIYRCEECDNTWNAEIFSRIRPGKLTDEELESFHRNDPVMSQSYAMNTEWLKKLQAELVLPEYTIDAIIPDDSQDLEIRIVNPGMMPYRISVVLRKKLCLSQTEFIRLVDRNQLTGKGGEDLKKGKLPREITVMMSRKSIVSS